MYGKLLSNVLFSPFFALFCFFFSHLLNELFLHTLLFVLRQQGVPWELKGGVDEGLYLMLRQCSVTRFTALHRLAVRDYQAVCITEHLDAKRTMAYLACGVYLFSTAEAFWTKECV